MNKKNLIFIVFLFLSACETSKNDSKYNKERFEKIISLTSQKSMQVEEKILVANQQISLKNSSFDFTNSFKGFVEIKNTDSSYFKNGYGLVHRYYKNNKYAIVANGFTSEYNITTDSILEVLGINSIFTKVKTTKKFESTIAYSSLPLLVEYIAKDSGYNGSYQLENFKDLNYRFAFENNNLDFLELNISSAFSYFYSCKEEVKLRFSFDELKKTIPDYPKTSGNAADDNDIQTLKTAGFNYIDNILSQLKYVCEDIKLIKSYPKNSKITYSYTSSNSNILDADGKFKFSGKEEIIILTMQASYNGSVFNTKTYNITTYEKLTSDDALGSISNPLYKGKKEIDKVEIYFIEMHEQYGDSIYIKAGDFDMLIDAGQASDSSYVVNTLREHCVDSRLEMLVATHAHSDHIGGMNSVINWANHISYSLDYGYQRQDYGTSGAVRLAMKNKSDYYSAISDALVTNKTIYISDDFYITLLDTGQYIDPSQDINGGDDNDASVTFIMTYKNHSYYFSGDLGNSGESYLVRTNQLKNVNLMKASHHASGSSNSLNLLSKIKPEVVCVSTALIDRGSPTSSAKDQVHPNRQALNRFYNVNAKVYCNFTMGTIKVTSDGNNALRVEGLGVETPYYINSKVITGEENKEFKNTAWANKYR